MSAVLVGLCGVSAGLSAAGRAEAVPVHAMVHFSSQLKRSAGGAALEGPEGAEPPLGYVRLPNGIRPIAPPPLDPRTDALMLLDSLGPEPPEPPPSSSPSPVAAADTAELRLYGMRLLPPVLVVKAGTRVTLRNDDRLPVTLRCAEAPGLLPAEPVPPGGHITVTVPAQGPGSGGDRLTLQSPEYPHLRGLWLLPRGVVTRLVVGERGTVGVAKLDLPEGRYRLTLLLGAEVAAQRELVVPPQGTEFVVRLGAPPGGGGGGSEGGNGGGGREGTGAQPVPEPAERAPRREP